MNKILTAVLVAALATMALSATAFAQSSGAAAYEQPPTHTTPGNVPPIPTAPPPATSTVVPPAEEEITPTVAGVSTPAPESPAVTPVATPAAPAPVAAAEDTGGTLPVTGFDALLILGAAAAAGGVGFALRKAAKSS